MESVGFYGRYMHRNFLRKEQTKKTVRRGTYHKAGFTCRKTKGVRTIVRTPFHTPCSARYSVLHLIGVLSGGNEPPLCKGRWLAKQDGGIVKAKISS